MGGWIKLHRSLIENDLWGKEPFTYGQAWVDLLLLANHKDGSFWKNHREIFVQRGQTGRSQEELKKRWKWSLNKVRRFLVVLSKREMITLKTNRLTSIITICNYEDYQGDHGHDDKTDDKTKGKTDERQTRRSKNEKNEKNTNGEKFTPPTQNEITLYIDQKRYTIDSEYYFAYYEEREWVLSNGKKMKCWKKNLNTWHTREQKNKKETAKDLFTGDPAYVPTAD